MTLREFFNNNPPPERIVPTSSLQWYCTDYNIMKTVHCWCIKNFSFCTLQDGDSIDSPVFRLGLKGELGFCLKLFPRNTNSDWRDYKYNDEKEHIAVFVGLVYNKLDAASIYGKFKLSLKNSSGADIKSLTKKCVFNPGRFRGWNPFMERKELYRPHLQFLPYDQLQVCCEIVVAIEKKVSTLANDVLVLQIPKCRLADDLATLYKNNKSSDLTVTVQNTTFHVHKAIVSARSPVFSAMLRHDMVETAKGTVFITDFDADIIDEMFRFMYTSKLRNIDKQTVCNLLAASDKYGMDNLKQICEMKLSEFVELGTVLDILSLAQAHNASKIRNICLQFIGCFTDRVLKCEKSKTVLFSNPEIVSDVIEAITASERNEEPDYL